MVEKKITLLIFSISNGGGCERIACGLANELTERKYSVAIINIYNDNSSFFSLKEEVKILPLYKKTTAPSKYHFPFVPIRIFNLLRRKTKKPDVLIGVGTDMSIYAMLAIKLLNIQFIAWEHFNFMVNTNDILASLGRKLCARYARFIVVLTNKDKALFENKLRIKGNVVCIPNFMTFPANYPSQITSKIAIAMGRYTYQKGFDNLIKIWGEVSKKKLKWHLKIIGRGEDKSMLEQMIKEQKLEDAITLIPATDNVTEYYQEASLFLLSSRWEGLPMVMIEAKSFGLPIVSFDCDTGPRDIIKENEDGILIPDQNIDVFASTVSELLQDRQRLQAMGKKALMNSEQFTANNIIQFWEDLFSVINHENKSSYS